MSLREELLIPIPGANPGGIELRYDPLFDKIKEARREEEDIPQGDWQTERKTADWPQVLKLTKDALTNKSKDLQLAVWLGEAVLKREGFGGFRDALDMMVGLLEQHWDHLYPALEGDDAEMRAAPLEWLGLKLPMAIGTVPLNKAGHSWFQYRDAETVPNEAAAAADSAKAEIRQAHIDEGKITPEEIERGFTATPKPWFKALVADIDATLIKLQNLDEISRERFGDAAPNYGKLRNSIEEVHRSARQLLKKKLELEPDPVESVASEGGVSVPDGVSLPGSVSAQLSVIPTSKEDAAARITVSAKFLRQAEPTNPASYLLLRGFRWGELRASGRSPDPRLLEAPTTATRTQLKSMLLDSRWDALLDACEGVMATPQGRGWLDLQRYALTACQQLGTEYEIVATAIRGALRSLLTDLPSLIDMTMMDDTAVANTETRKWLSGLLERDVDAETGDAGQNGAMSELPLGARNGRSAAMAAVRAGKTDRAIALLLREAETEKSLRGKFLVQTELASIMVTAGHVAVAQPLLEELLRHIDAHKLEEWESGDVVARPLALLYRVLENSGDAGVRQSLYLRICRLDPLQAIGFAQG